MRKIVTNHARPPIPTNAMDWVAYFDGQEEAGHYGYGKTEQAAIFDLLENNDIDNRFWFMLGVARGVTKESIPGHMTGDFTYVMRETETGLVDLYRIGNEQLYVGQAAFNLRRIDYVLAVSP